MRNLVLAGLTMVLGAICATPASACRVAPTPKHIYWPSVPETLDVGEVALEVMFLRNPTKEELLAKYPDLAAVVVTNCGEPAQYTYRVLRVLAGDYKGPSEFHTRVLGGIADNPEEGEIQIVVGNLWTADNLPPLFQMRSPDRLKPFLIPEIRLN